MLYIKMTKIDYCGFDLTPAYATHTCLHHSQLFTPLTTLTPAYATHTCLGQPAEESNTLTVFHIRPFVQMGKMDSVFDCISLC